MNCTIYFPQSCRNTYLHHILDCLYTQHHAYLFSFSRYEGYFMNQLVASLWLQRSTKLVNKHIAHGQYDHRSNSRECGSFTAARSLLKAVFFTTSHLRFRITYSKSRENPYGGTTSHARTNPYQVLQAQVACAVSDCAMVRSLSCTIAPSYTE